MKAKIFTNLMTTAFLGGLVIAVIGVGMESEDIQYLGSMFLVPVAFLAMIIAKERGEDDDRSQSQEDLRKIQQRGLISYLCLLAVFGFIIGLAKSLFLAVICAAASVFMVMMAMFIYWALFVNLKQKEDENLLLNSL